MNTYTGLTIVVPVLNEEHNIEPLVKRIHTSVNNICPYEIIFVDDHSEDNTAKVVKKLKKKYPISYYTKVGKRGKAQSLLQGFGYATYDLLAMIDSDLQYAPESIPDLLKGIDAGADIVVARRKEVYTSFMRKLFSRTFNYLFCQKLHALHFDVQSGLKVFKREIIERLTLDPFAWTFDLEFLLAARDAGYKIGAADIIFHPRGKGQSKVNLIRASLQIGLAAILLKLKSSPIIPFHHKNHADRGSGFHYNKVEFIHYSDLHFTESAVQTILDRQKIFIYGALALIAVGLYINWMMTIIMFISVITVIYFSDLLFNVFLILRSFNKNTEIKISDADINQIEAWPRYTIFCPLYHEWAVIKQFVKAIDRLDYPLDKLQVQLLLEEDDTETIEHARAMNLPEYFEIIIVPNTLPKTKPKACNYGLRRATGEYAVIFDAEDMPDPKQLKKAVVGFRKAGDKIACIQAKLNYYNKEQNLLTRLFTAEYSLWFDLILTGLQSLQAPIPLGGTSNHFRIKQLREVQGWDSFNVTEDCDLGIRLAKKGYQTAIIDSLTLEEANSDLMNWLNQRSRWIKGYMQTYLVHMRRPQDLLHKNLRYHFFTFQLVVGGKILSLFINPIMWITTILYFSLRVALGPSIEQFFPGPVLYLGVSSLIFGNFLYVYIYMIACGKRGQYGLIKYVFLIPFYWIAMSIAGWMALIQLIFKPHYWPKTKHGLYQLEESEEIQQEQEYLKRDGTVRVMPSLFPFINRLSIWKENIVEDFIAVFKFRSRTKAQKKHKKILILNWRDTRHRFSGGAEVYVHELAKRWVQEGHAVTLFCGNDSQSPQYEVIDGVEIVRRGGFFFVYIWAFVYYILKFRGNYDLVIDCQNGIPFFTPLYARTRKFSIMFHVHQDVFYKSLPRPLAMFAAFLEHTIMPFLYRNVEFITISDSTKKDLERLRVGRKGIQIIHPGVDTAKYTPGEKAGHPVILYVGRLKKYKSVDMILKVAKEIIKTTPQAEFIIAGDGEERQHLERLARQFKIQDHITFLGKVSEEKKVALYKRAWVFLNPSYMEGWGITNIEANACGTPVVASNVPGIRDSVKNPHSGILVEYGKVNDFTRVIYSFITNASRRDRFSKESRKWAMQFDWDTSAQQLLHLITKK